jgi:hypothetical protein
LELLDQNPDTSLPVIVVKGRDKKLVGMVSAWDVLEKLVMNALDPHGPLGEEAPCAEGSESKGSEGDGRGS